MKINDRAKVHRFHNAVKRKLWNNHVTICSDDDGTYQFEVISFDNKFAAEPVIMHEVKRNVLRVSLFRMNKETLEAFILNAIELLNIQDATMPGSRSREKSRCSL